MSKCSSDLVPLPKSFILSFSNWQENGSPSHRGEGKSYRFGMLRWCWRPQVQWLVTTSHWEGEKWDEVINQRGNKLAILKFYNMSKQYTIFPPTAENIEETHKLFIPQNNTPKVLFVPSWDKVIPSYDYQLKQCRNFQLTLVESFSQEIWISSWERSWTNSLLYLAHNLKNKSILQKLQLIGTATAPFLLNTGIVCQENWLNPGSIKRLVPKQLKLYLPSVAFRNRLAYPIFFAWSTNLKYLVQCQATVCIRVNSPEWNFTVSRCLTDKHIMKG